jgi:hypothetical protein
MSVAAAESDGAGHVVDIVARCSTYNQRTELSATLVR